VSALASALASVLASALASALASMLASALASATVKESFLTLARQPRNDDFRRWIGLEFG
jgi:hypothetical protein